MGKLNMKERMAIWLKDHPKATAAEAYEAGYFACTDAWCHEKVDKMEQCCQLMKEIIS